MQTEEPIVLEDDETHGLDDKSLDCYVSGDSYVKPQTENQAAVLETCNSLEPGAELQKQCDVHCPGAVSPKVEISEASTVKVRANLQRPQTARKSFTKVDGSRSQHSSSEDGSLELQVTDKSQNSDGEEKISAKILNFNCLKCKDNVKYSPNDLHKHYQMLHHGEMPTYPCEMCSFSANDFHLFKQHRQIHKNTLVKCEICNDDSIYSLLDLTKHFSSEHCANGSFLCEKCNFSTKDVGTFVQHLHKHNASYSSVDCLQLQVTDRSQNSDGEEKLAAKILNFNCPKCKDAVKYSPNDLHKHYQQLHHGEMPTYPCEMCSFSANDFHLFKQHRQKHKKTPVSCEVCNDDRIYSLLDLTKHLSSAHCVNGSFFCEKCKFSTKDVGTFVQHFHKHNITNYSCDKCHHVSLTKEAFQKHLLVHSSVFPFNCRYCDYGATCKEHVLQHIDSAHKKQVIVPEVKEENKKTAGLKLVLKRCQTETSKKTLWKQKNEKRATTESTEDGMESSASTHLSSSQKSLSNGEPYLDSTSKQGIRIFTTSLNKQNVQGALLPSKALQHRKAENGSSANLGVLKDAVHGPTVLMVQNSRISVPANYSAKFVGFKVVNGKQHLVIKLLPTNKNSVYSLGLQTHSGTTSESSNLFQNTASSDLATSSKPEKTLCDIADMTPKYENNQSLFPLYSLPLKQCTEMTGTQNGIALEPKKELPPLSLSPETVFLSKSPTHTFASVSGAEDSLQSGSCMLLNGKSLESAEKALQLKEKHPLEKGPRVCESKIEDTTGMSADSLNQVILPFHNYSKKLSFKSSYASVKPRSSLSDKVTDSNQTHFLQNGGNISVNKSPEDCLSSALKSDCLSEQPAIVDVNGALGSHPIHDEVAVSSRNDPFFSRKDLTQKSQIVNQTDDLQIEDDSQLVISNEDSPLMPKIMSVFSLQSENVPSFLSSETNNFLNDVQNINVNKSSSLQNQDERDYNEPCKNLNRQASFAHSEYIASKDSKLGNSDWSEMPPPISKEDPISKSTSVEEQSSSLTLPAFSHLEQTCSSFPKNPMTSIGSILKSYADAIITNQLVKDGICVSSQGSSSTGLGPGKISGTVSLNSKSMPDSVQPAQNIVPLHIVNQPALQVSSNSFPFTTTPLALQTEKLAPVPSTQNSNTGMVLAFSSGPLGTVAKVAGSNDEQVLNGANPNSCTNMLNTDLKGKNSLGVPRTVILQKAPAAVGTLVNPVIGQVSGLDKNVCLKSENSSIRPRTIISKAALSVGNSLSAVPGPVFLLNSSSSSFSGTSVNVATPLVGQQILVGQNVSASSGTVLHQGTVPSGLNAERSNSGTHQKQPLYALLPDGRQAVFVRCVAPPRPILSKGYTYLQPKNSSVGHQKVLLKIVRPSSTTGLGVVSQPANNATAIKMEKIVRPALQIKPSVLCPAGVVQSSPSFVLSANTVFFNPVAESDVSLSANKPLSPTSTVAQLLSCSSVGTAIKESTDKVDGDCALSTRSKASQNETDLQQKLSGICSVKTVGKKSKVPKRKKELLFEEPPVKKRTLPRKCKEKKKYVDIESESEHSDEEIQSEHSDTEIQSEHTNIEIQSDVIYTKVPKDIVKVLRLLPFNSEQLVKCPRRNQPVVVLNHPDADVPEVANVMKTIKKFKGHVVKVSLSQRTINALHCDLSGVSEESAITRCRRPKPVSPVKERFVLKLTLKKTSKNNYQIVKAGTKNRMESSFTCWFCGRIFDNQDDWAGHGQRHLIEATRDWNILC
ncbi:zinc finger protein 518A [Protopterus annectens]|uniref:zinc finger protein 518A n=1 Tax=Protopterus annectens TaxID=7888 RepID=UPI001CF9B15E|nr:zinc finger protein 518A [Protopterus annectens]